jgi:hypothetical protein
MAPAANIKAAIGAGGRQHSDDGDGCKTPALRDGVNLFHFPRWIFALQGFLAAFSSEPLGEEAADH